MADDLYELLGIAPDADDAELRRVWRELARKWHPDSAGTDTTFIFQKLLAAYETLADPARRAEYDATRAGPRKKAPGIMLTRVSGPLAVLLGRGTLRQLGDARYELVLDADEARTGGMVTIAMDVATTDGEQRFSAWLSVPPDFAERTVVRPSVLLPGMLVVPQFVLVRATRDTP